jgi:hypothetical protein
VFNYDAVINPMPAYRSDKLKLVESLILEDAVTDEELASFTLPDSVEPILSE